MQEDRTLSIEEQEMIAKADLISKIVAAEWQMHQDVPGIGGRADCQEDFRTFEASRSSQALSWSEACLASYLNDLKLAEKESRNLLTEKYARMMKSTSPEEYALMEHLEEKQRQAKANNPDESSVIPVEP